MRATAEKLFHGEEGYNCAQAVLKTFQEEYNLSDATILEHKKSGGGRVDGNICGALHAVKILTECEKTSEEISASFADIAGSVKCKEIKKAGKLSCRGCVGSAAELFQTNINN